MKEQDYEALDEALDFRREVYHSSMVDRTLANACQDIVRMGLGSALTGSFLYGLYASTFGDTLYPVTTAVSAVSLVAMRFGPLGRLRDVIEYTQEEGVNDSAAKASLLR